MQGAVYLSYVAEIFLKRCSIKAKSVKFGHPNKQVLTPEPGSRSECVLRKTLKGWAIYSPNFVVYLSFRITKLQGKRLAIQKNDLSHGDI
jgi:hypothetical protein